jgi:hypothetical protein
VGVYYRVFFMILAGIGVGCDFWVLAAESVVGGRELKVIPREQSRVYSEPVGRGKCLFLSAVLFLWKANSYHQVEPFMALLLFFILPKVS